MTPTCTPAAPYRGPRSSHHPDMGPVDVTPAGHVVWGCPNCGLRFDTKMTEAEVYRELELPVPA